MRILLTGFEPFQGENRNPSAELAKALGEELQIDYMILPVSFQKVFDLVKVQLELKDYHFVILLGQAGGRSKISLEKVALNLIDTESKDEEGQAWSDRRIQDAGPEAYFNSLPLRQWLEGPLKGKPVEISSSAGLFVCNYLYYQVLNYFKGPCLFVHLPFMKEQVIEKLSPTPFLDKVVMKECLQLIIDQCRALGEIK